MKKEIKSAQGESPSSATNEIQKEKRTEKKKRERKEEGRDVARPRGFLLVCRLEKVGGEPPGGGDVGFFLPGWGGSLVFVVVTMTWEILNSVLRTE